jgi:hypothetical protein
MLHSGDALKRDAASRMVRAFHGRHPAHAHTLRRADGLCVGCVEHAGLTAGQDGDVLQVRLDEHRFGRSCPQRGGHHALRGKEDGASREDGHQEAR